MKKVLSFVVCLLLLASCTDKTSYVITGTVDKADLNGDTIYLYQSGAEAPLASAVVADGAFTIKGVLTASPVMALLRFSEGSVKPQGAYPGTNAPYRATFVLESGAKYKADLTEEPTVTGTPENDALAALQKEVGQLMQPLKDLGKVDAEDTAAVAEAQQKYEEINGKISDAVKTYITNNPNALTAGKLFYDFRYNFEEATQRDLLAKAGDVFKSAPGVDKLIEHLAVLDKVAVGKAFTDIAMPNPDGKAIKLSDYAGKGKVVLVDFWASWCPPCRADMPHLVSVYKQYKGKNFEIVGVSLDRNVEDWKKGIKDLNITWPQMSDVKFWQSEGAALYGVNSIPHTVLIDKDGTIIAKNLRGEALDKKLAEVVK